LSEQPPAAQLSLAELAAANVQPTFVTVEPVERPPATIYRRIVEALQTGELDIMEADRLVMPLLFGQRGEVPDQFQEGAAASGVPDIALFWSMQRLPFYPDEVQAELRSWFPGVRESQVAAAAPRFSLLAPSVVYASSQELSPADGTCVPSENIFGGTFLNLGEHVVGGGFAGGTPLRLVMCGRSPADPGAANHVATMAREAISEISAFFGKPFQQSTNWSGPEFRIFLEQGAIISDVATGDSASHGGMLSCHEIGVNLLVDECELKASVIHEVFHCLDMQAQGYTTAEQVGAGLKAGTFYGRQPDWVSEGAAVWAEDRFAPDNNAEWGYHQTMAEFPFHPLESRGYTAGIFFNFLQQHAGGDDAVRKTLEKFTDRAGTGPIGGERASTLEEVFPWPLTWFDFSEALSGFKPLYEQGRPELTDQPTFPYEESVGCAGETKYVTQEKHGRRLPLGPHEAHFYDLEIPALSVTYEIVELQSFDAQYLDVGFGGAVVDRIQSETIKVTAILRMDSGDEIVDWSDLWLAEGLGAEPILMPPSIGSFSPKETEGRFRMCLTDEVEGCDDVPEQKIYRGLYEIDIIMANAGTREMDNIGVAPDESFLVLLPGAMRGWKAIRVEIEPSFPQGQGGF
jgi:hypothetical protein